VTDALPDQDAPPANEEKRLRRSALRVMRAVFSGAGAAIAAVAAAIALAFNVFPWLSPDPGTNLSATMKVRSLEPGVRFGDFKERRFDDTPTDQGDAKGTIVNVQVNVAGRKHSGLRLYQYLYHISNGRRVADQTRDTGLDERFEADTPNDQWVQPVWVNFAGETNVFARIELYDGSTMLAYVDTKDLAGPPRE